MKSSRSLYYRYKIKNNTKIGELYDKGMSVGERKGQKNLIDECRSLLGVVMLVDFLRQFK